jgi:hypothetical protein
MTDTCCMATDELEVPTSCSRCNAGRLVGQAEHEGEVWRYYLACTDCGMKIELSQDSLRAFSRSAQTVAAPAGSTDEVGSAIRAPADAPPSPTKPAGRKCVYPGCETILSAYNTTAACWAHTGPSFN